MPRTARHPQSTPARPPWEAPGRRLLSQRPARGWLLGPLLLLPATAPILLGCPASLVTPNMLETAKPLMPFPRPVGSPWWWSLQGMCDHKFRKEVCVCVCVCPQGRGVCVSGALGLLQPGALSGLSRPEAVQPASRMAGGIPGPEAPRAGPAGAGRTGRGSLVDPLHLVLSISPQAPGSQ